MENEAQFDEIENSSKSQLKRESHALQDLGKKLAALSADQLARIPLDQPVIEAIALAQRIQNKRSALKRHYQFLGKLLRARDVDPILTALAELDNESQQSIQQHHRAERWRDRVVEQGNSAIDELVIELTRHRSPEITPVMAQPPERQNRRQTQPTLPPDLQRNQASVKRLNLIVLQPRTFDWGQTRMALT